MGENGQTDPEPLRRSGLVRSSMRIGIDCRALQNFSRYLGIGTYSANLTRALAQANGHHQMIPFGFSPRRSRLKRIDPSLPYPIDRQGFFITGRRSLLRQLKAHRVDLCHLLEFTPPFAAADRTVATVYDLIPLIFPKVYLPWRRVRSGWNLRSYYRFLKRVQQIVAISEHTRMDLIQILGIPKERITVIYPGLSPVFRPLEDDQKISGVLARYDIQHPYVLYVGSCDWRKNITGLLSAFSQFRRHGFEDFQLVLVGKDAPLKQGQLHLQASVLGLSESLRLTGFVSEEELVALYNAATLLVYPSFYEGFGFPPLEAMACGTPVVTSANSSLKEVADGCALLVNPHRDEELVEGMCRLAEDQGLRETLIRRGLARARQFTWDRAAGETLSLYERLGK